MKGTRLLTVILLLVISMPATDLVGKSGKTRRYSIIIGANNGGPGRERLRYAVSDARSLKKVLNRMGGISGSNNRILVEPDRRQFFNAIYRLNTTIRREKRKYRRTELIFYYSGHSDCEGILLNRQKITYREIKRSLRAIPADVHIAILDSCSSGAFTRLKGGKMRSPFLMDTSYDMKGYAYMTSSSDNEASQESDRIGGSFFTHYLVSGLRGAADTTGDGRVTLNEAYQYAYSETLTRTEKTLSGPQHPHYNIRMTGKGDVVMTDIRKSGAGLRLHKNLYGRVAIRDRYNRLVAELNKPAGREIAMGLDTGRYTIINKRNGRLYETSLYLRGGSQRRISRHSMKQTTQENTTPRGEKDLSAYQTMWFSFQFIPSFGSDLKIIHNFSFSIFGSYTTRLQGLALTFGVDIVGKDATGVQVAAIGNITGDDTRYVQGSMIFNITGRDLTGLQLTGIFSSAGQNVTGVQASGIFNTAGENVSGVQVAGVFNYADDRCRGLQVSSVFNHAKKFTGFQWSMINLAPEEVTGMQLGIVNYGKKTRGLQLGMVNISEDLDGAAIGLVNIVTNGITRFDIHEEETGFTRFAAKHGTKNFYTLYALGFDHRKNMSIGLGFGGRFSAGNFFFDMDISAHSLYHLENLSDTALHSQVRAATGYRFFKRMGVFIGVSYNYLYRIDNSPVDSKPLYGFSSSDGNHHHWPGVFFGVQI